MVYAGERASDPGDQALLGEAADTGRIFLTKDQDIGVLVHRDQLMHAGILLIDDLGEAVAETALILAALGSSAARLTAGAFLRVTRNGVREARG